MSTTATGQPTIFEDITLQDLGSRLVRTADNVTQPFAQALPPPPSSQDVPEDQPGATPTAADAEGVPHEHPSEDAATPTENRILRLSVSQVVIALLAFAGALGMLYPQLADHFTNRKSLDLAEWEAWKDFRDECRSLLTEKKDIGYDCKEALDHPLTKPPGTGYPHLARSDGYNAMLRVRMVLADTFVSTHRILKSHLRAKLSLFCLFAATVAGLLTTIIRLRRSRTEPDLECATIISTTAATEAEDADSKSQDELNQTYHLDSGTSHTSTSIHNSPPPSILLPPRIVRGSQQDSLRESGSIFTTGTDNNSSLNSPPPELRQRLRNKDSTESLSSTSSLDLSE